MPVVTQSRNKPNLSFGFTNWLNGKVVSKGTNTYPTGSQTTTSFRTGPKFEDPFEDDVVAASQKGSGLEAYRSMFHQLREEVQGQFDIGHEFSTEGLTYRYPMRHVHFSRYEAGQKTYDGYMIPSIGTSSEFSDNYVTPTSSKVQADGRRAIALTIPTAPEAALATFLGEMRERLPALIGSDISRRGVGPSSIGNEYLNVEFGIKPMISDIQKMAQSVLAANTLAAQYVRDSGRVVRRKRLLYDDSKVTITDRYTANPVWVEPFGYGKTNYGLTYGPVHVTDVLSSKAWFSGAYSYHLSEAFGFLGRMKRYEELANHLLGSRITPETVWELTPWSWLLDWNGDIGRFMHNVSALSSDSTVLRYGYVMHRTESARIRSQTIYHTGGSSVIRKESIKYKKTRTKSNPYGFDALISNYTPRQWSILAALGMTKAPNTLR